MAEKPPWSCGLGLQLRWLLVLALTVFASHAAGKTFPSDKAALLDFKAGLHNDQVRQHLVVRLAESKLHQHAHVKPSKAVSTDRACTLSGNVHVCVIKDSQLLEMLHRRHQCAWKILTAMALNLVTCAAQTVAGCFLHALRDLKTLFHVCRIPEPQCSAEAISMIMAWHLHTATAMQCCPSEASGACAGASHNME